MNISTNEENLHFIHSTRSLQCFEESTYLTGIDLTQNFELKVLWMTNARLNCMQQFIVL